MAKKKVVEWGKGAGLSKKQTATGRGWSQKERKQGNLAKVAECHLQVTCGINEKIAGLQVPMKHIGRVNVF